MKISKELLTQMENDDKAELEELTPSQIASYEEMEGYFLFQRMYIPPTYLCNNPIYL